MSGEMILTYQYKDGKKFRIFGEHFAFKYRNECKIIVDGAEKPFTSFYTKKINLHSAETF
jgi:hypothetical protein